MKSRILKIMPVLFIMIYGFVLIVMNLWEMKYYGTWGTLGFGFLFYMPYCLGGAFLACFFLARIVIRVGLETRISTGLIYLLLLVFLVYVSRWHESVLGKIYSGSFDSIVQGLALWSKGFTEHENPLILWESLIGFGLGELFQIRKNRIFR